MQDADAIYREEIANAGLDRSIGQYFAALTNMRSVGVMGELMIMQSPYVQSIQLIS